MGCDSLLDELAHRVTVYRADGSVSVFHADMERQIVTETWNDQVFVARDCNVASWNTWQCPTIESDNAAFALAGDSMIDGSFRPGWLEPASISWWRWHVRWVEKKISK